MATIETTLATATIAPIASSTLRDRNRPIPKIPASDPTRANNVKEKLWPMRTPAPTALIAAKSRAGPMPVTRLATIEPAAKGSAEYVAAAVAAPSKLEEKACASTKKARVRRAKRIPAERIEA